MPAVRLSFLVAALIALVHGVAALPSGGEPALVARSLVFWQLVSAMLGGLVAIISWWILGRRARTLALAIAPTLLVGLELSAWLVSEINVETRSASKSCAEGTGTPPRPCTRKRRRLPPGSPASSMRKLML